MKYTINMITAMIASVLVWAKKYTVSVKTDCGVTYNCVALNQEVVDFINFCDRYDFPYEVSVQAKSEHKVLLTRGKISSSLYQIKSKTGEYIGCSSYEEAMSEACKRSTKASVWAVYKDYERLETFIGKKQLVQWTNLYAKISSSESRFVDIYQGKVRMRFTYCDEWVIKGKHIKHFKSDSITFHADGKVYINENKKIRLFIYGKEHLSVHYVSYGMRAALLAALVKIRPEINIKLYATAVTITEIAAVFSYPSLMYRFDTFKKTHILRTNKASFCKGMPHDILDDHVFIKNTAHKADVPETKTFLKLYQENMELISLARYTKTAGITNADLIRRILMLTKSLPHHESFVLLETFRVSQPNEMIRRIVNVKGEAATVRMIEAESTRLVYDIIGMMDMYNVDEDIVNEIIKECSNIQSIHDTLVGYVNSLRHSTTYVDKIITYTDEEKKLNVEYDDVSFALAESKKDLAIVGRRMGICVGGYGDAACKKQLIIVKMVSHDKYVGCIELHGKTIVQIKAKFNNPLEQQYKRSLDKWIKQNRLSIAQCDDYKHIGQEWERATRYDYMDPDRFAEETHDGNRLIIIKSDPHPWDYYTDDDDYDDETWIQ